MKPLLRQLDTFLQVIYRDSRLKNTIVLWTFLILVLPGAVIAAVGVSIKVVSTVTVILLLPLQFGIFLLSRREERKAQTVAVTTDATTAAWVELLMTIASQQTPVVPIQQCLLQGRPRPDDDTLTAYFTRIASDDEIREAALNRLLQLSAVHGQSSQVSTGTRTAAQQGQPAWALALSGGLA